MVAAKCVCLQRGPLFIFVPLTFFQLVGFELLRPPAVVTVNTGAGGSLNKSVNAHACRQRFLK